MNVTRWNFIAAALLLSLASSDAIAQDSDEESSDAKDESDSGSSKESSDKDSNADGDTGAVDKLLERIRVGGRLQTRLQATSDETGAKRKNRGAFSIHRAKLFFNGHAHSSKIRYNMQAELGQGNVLLEDYFVDYRTGEGETRIRVGQFKLPFSRQQIASSGMLTMVDRSIVDEVFGNGRDIGLELHNDLGMHNGLEWALGVFNGTGIFSPTTVTDPITGEVTDGSSNVPDQIRPAAVARIGYSTGGINGYSESDLESGPQRYSIGLAAMYQGTGGPNGAIARAGTDFILKDKGLSVTGGVYAAFEGPEEADLTYVTVGGYAQLGYVRNKKWEPALRYALVNQRGGDKVHEIVAGLSLFKFGHDFKLATDATLLINDIGDAPTKDLRVRTQLQITF